MTFDELLDQVCDLLKHQEGVSYRALKIRFQLAGPRPSRGIGDTPAPGPLPPRPWYAVCRARPAGASPTRALHRHRAVSHYEHDLLVAPGRIRAGTGGGTGRSGWQFEEIARFVIKGAHRPHVLQGAALDWCALPRKGRNARVSLFPVERGYGGAGLVVGPGSLGVSAGKRCQGLTPSPAFACPTVLRHQCLAHLGEVW
jgi:hypothetical protein